MKLIPIYRGNRWHSEPTGEYAIVDDEDLERISKHRWFFSTKRYAKRGERKNGKYKMIYMAQEVINAPDGLQVDHKNGIKLDNQKHNLRTCTNAQNSRNRRNRVKQFGQYKGAIRQTRNHDRWQAVIMKDYKRYQLGTFGDEHTAALMYDFWATYLHGEFADTNFTVISTSEQLPGGVYGQVAKREVSPIHGDSPDTGNQPATLQEAG